METKQKHSTLPLKRKDDAQDIFVLITSAGLDAAGLGPIAPIWESFFPSGSPDFSEGQIQQMTTAFEQAFSKGMYQVYLTKFETYTNLVGNYTNDPVPGQLPQLINDTADIADQILANGSIMGAKIYLAAASLYLVTLAYAYTEASPENKPGAQKNIGTAAKKALDHLLDFEQQLLLAVGFETWCGFKGYTQFNDESRLDPTVITWFGENYRDAVISLIDKVQLCTPELVSDIPVPAYVIKFMNFNSDAMKQIWSVTTHAFSPIAFYSCSPIATEEHYLPLGDLAVTGYSESGHFVPPSFVPYIRPYSLPAKLLHLSDEGAKQWVFSQIYNDQGSGNKNNFAAYDFADPDHQCIQFSTINGDGYSSPNYARVTAYLRSLITTNELGASLWSDVFTGAKEDCTVYENPQFRNYGLYHLYRSHNRPSPDRVPAFTGEAFRGHPVQQNS